MKRWAAGLGRFPTPAGPARTIRVGGVEHTIERPPRWRDQGGGRRGDHAAEAVLAAPGGRVASRSSRKGIRRARAKPAFTARSPSAQVVHGRPVPAKAREKKSAVSRIDPSADETSGACHHLAFRSRSNTCTSVSWATRKAVPEAAAMRGPRKPDGERYRASETCPDHAPCAARAEAPVGEVGDEKGERIGEGSPREPVVEGKLDEDVRRGDDQRHRGDPEREPAGADPVRPFPGGRAPCHRRRCMAGITVIP